MNDPLSGRQCPPCDGLCSQSRYCPARKLGEPISWSLLLAVIVIIVVAAWDDSAAAIATAWRRVRPKSLFEWFALVAVVGWSVAFLCLAAYFTLTLLK